MDRCGLICRTILERPDVTQRELARCLDVSLGTAHGLLKECAERGYIGESGQGEGRKWELLEAGRDYLKPCKVDGALVIAAGFGSRFVPLTFETPKGLLEVFGERMIERQLRQLNEAGIHDITIVVGYLKEKFEYLTDKFGVKLLYNPEYKNKNTLATIYHAREVLRGRNMYLLSSDNWMRENMYHSYECGAWYSASFQNGDTKEWCLSFGKKGRIQEVTVGGRDQWVMYGPAYFSREFTAEFLPVLEGYYQAPGTEQFYWEQVYMDMLSGEARRRLEREKLVETVLQAGGQDPEKWKKIDMYANCQPENQVYEFENLEELRCFDDRYQHHSDNQAMALVSRVFGIPESEIHDLKCLKSGMTNKSFIFRAKGGQYICRVPGPGTDLLINRKQEKRVYDAVRPLGVTERVLYMDENTGYKISEYYEGSRNADSGSWEDMERCMEVLRKLHRSGIRVEHRFDIRERIDFHEKLCLTHGGVLFEDYEKVRGWVNWLLDELEKLDPQECICHIDANVDNYLFLENGEIRLIDWEYAGMCWPIMDISMCAIYSYYGEEDTERLLRLYLCREPEPEELFMVYACAGLGGFLWSLWAVYKKALGEEFGEYTLIMYRYAKKYYKKCVSLKEKINSRSDKASS